LNIDWCNRSIVWLEISYESRCVLTWCL